MGNRNKYRNWHLEAYRAGRVDEIPADALPHVKAALEAQGDTPLPSVPDDASDGPATEPLPPKGWDEV